VLSFSTNYFKYSLYPPFEKISPCTIIFMDISFKKLKTNILVFIRTKIILNHFNGHMLVVGKNLKICVFIFIEKSTKHTNITSKCLYKLKLKSWKHEW